MSLSVGSCRSAGCTVVARRASDSTNGRVGGCGGGKSVECSIGHAYRHRATLHAFASRECASVPEPAVASAEAETHDTRTADIQQPAVSRPHVQPAHTGDASACLTVPTFPARWEIDTAVPATRVHLCSRVLGRRHPTSLAPTCDRRGVHTPKAKPRGVRPEQNKKDHQEVRGVDQTPRTRRWNATRTGWRAPSKSTER